MRRFSPFCLFCSIHKFRSSIIFISLVGLGVLLLFKSFRSIWFRSFSKNDAQPLSWACFSAFFNCSVPFVPVKVRSFPRNDAQPYSSVFDDFRVSRILISSFCVFYPCRLCNSSHPSTVFQLFCSFPSRPNLYIFKWDVLKIF